MKRKVCVNDGAIKVVFAQEADRRMIYDVSVADSKIILSMFDNPDDFRWEDIRDEKAEFFDEIASINKYLLIEYQNEIVGIFYHTYHAAPIKCGISYLVCFKRIHRQGVRDKSVISYERLY